MTPNTLHNPLHFLHPLLLNHLVVPLDALKPLHHLRRHLGTAQLRRPRQDPPTLHGHQPRYDRDIRKQPALVPAQRVLPAQKRLHVVKQLRHDEVRARPRLLPQVRQVVPRRLRRRVRRRGVPLRIRRDADAEPVAVFPSNVPHEVDRIRELLLASVAVHGRQAVFLSPGHVAAQREDVADAEVLAAREGVVEDALPHVGACKVQAGGEAVLLLADLSELERLGGGGAAGAPGHGDEEGLKACEAREAGVEVVEAGLRLGGEEFEGKPLRFGRQVVDFLGEGFHWEEGTLGTFNGTLGLCCGSGIAGDSRVSIFNGFFRTAKQTRGWRMKLACEPEYWCNAIAVEEVDAVTVDVQGAGGGI